jgi:hypothetical protein
MYEFLKGSPKVIIDLPSGLFSFQRQSAAGKTYLASQLRMLRGLGEPVDSYTVEDLRRGGIYQALTAADYTAWDLKVVLLDRYDLYTQKFDDEIYRLSKTCTVLIDCKGRSYLTGVHDCRIRRDASTLEVYRYGVRIRGQ